MAIQILKITQHLFIENTLKTNNLKINTEYETLAKLVRHIGHNLHRIAIVLLGVTN